MKRISVFNFQMRRKHTYVVEFCMLAMAVELLKILIISQTIIALITVKTCETARMRVLHSHISSPHHNLMQNRCTAKATRTALNKLNHQKVKYLSLVCIHTVIIHRNIKEHILIFCCLYQSFPSSQYYVLVRPGSQLAAKIHGFLILDTSISEHNASFDLQNRYKIMTRPRGMAQADDSPRGSFKFEFFDDTDKSQVGTNNNNNNNKKHLRVATASIGQCILTVRNLLSPSMDPGSQLKWAASESFDQTAQMQRLIGSISIGLIVRRLIHFERLISSNVQIRLSMPTDQSAQILLFVAVLRDPDGPEKKKWNCASSMEFQSQ